MSSFYVLAATGGLIILHASQVQPKNTSSVLIANFLSIAVATITYWACGFAFAVGDGSMVSSNLFLSHTRFFLIDATDADYAMFAQNAVVLGLVIVIANSGFIARMRCWIYPIIIIVISGFTYPCVHHWIYAQDGWLRSGIDIASSLSKRTITYNDENGSASIHIFAGACAFIGTILVGSRKDRDNRKFKPLGGNLNPLIALGGIIAIVGIIAKNSTRAGALHSLALTNNILAAQASALVAFSLKRIKFCGDTSGTKALINGALAGVVGVSCAPHEYHPYGGFVIGIVAGLAYVMWTALFHCCRVDDPTDSAAVHLGAGLWASLAGPIFRKDNGVIYTGTTLSFEIFGWQLLGALAVFVWAGLTLFFVVLPFVIGGCTTYKEKALQQGLDVYELADPAFPGSSQYSQGFDDNVMDDIIPTRYSTKGYDNSSFHATLNNGGQWENPEMDWGVAKY